eukprot:m.316348 g.316348  ORF g.316348 m.316348 type:complete len:73 (-) comp15983_c0_seq1:35-253(-)
MCQYDSLRRDFPPQEQETLSRAQQRHMSDVVLNFGCDESMTSVFCTRFMTMRSCLFSFLLEHTSQYPRCMIL